MSKQSDYFSRKSQNVCDNDCKHDMETNDKLTNCHLELTKGTDLKFVACEIILLL